MPNAFTVRTTVDTRRLNSILGSLGANTDEALRKVAFQVKAEATTLMQLPHSGRDDGNHIASAPGEAPAIDTGALVNSIYVATSKSNSPPMPDVVLPTPRAGVVHVGPSVIYGAVLEFGAGMAPRPFMRPAVNAVTRWVERNPDIFRQTVTGERQ